MANRHLLQQPNRKAMSTALQVDDTIMKLLLSECGQTPTKTLKLHDEEVQAVLYHVMKRREEVEAYYNDATDSYDDDDTASSTTTASTMAATAPNVKLQAAALSVISDRSRSSRSTTSSSRSRDDAASSRDYTPARPDSPAYSSSAASVMQQRPAAAPTTATAGTTAAAAAAAAATVTRAVLPKLCRPVPPPSLQRAGTAVPASHDIPAATASATGSAPPVRPTAPQRVYADNNDSASGSAASATGAAATAANTGGVARDALPVQPQVGLLLHVQSVMLSLSA
jgi:hypothetical protein